jgi:ABC-type cobalamin/Fe3+-siderophores transport system ATPase subunit
VKKRKQFNMMISQFCAYLFVPITSHLDKVNAGKCMQLIQERCNEQNAGCILTTLDANKEIIFDKEIKL